MNIPETGDLGEFLRTRRAALTPADAGLTSYGRRRVPGLRREELAQLAGISIAYYTRLEQGQSTGASDSIIEALARALRLRDDERAHLYDLARPRPAARRRAPRAEHATTAGRQLLAAMDGVPAVLVDPRNDVLAWNRLGHALLAGHLPADAPARPADRPNLTRLLFLDRHTRELHRAWSEEAALAVASLRFVAAQQPDDRALSDLIGELTVKSPEFAGLWAKHAVRLCTSGVKRLHHPEVGDLDLDFQVLHLPDTGGQRIVTHTAAPDSGSAYALALLAQTLPAARKSSPRDVENARDVPTSL
ncbi:helix-turn-helix transcriptional regulator [Hamadaea tsunoensis]|uniref:helix-turn-helix transcriptional regulator n=1 Tax=Hamadaea tsunoensis TaxID=53368 RepID=UPI000419CD96|nr:helix-turn-helix transcriptional regulator [Hamadaea tsunoensis]